MGGTKSECAICLLTHLAIKNKTVFQSEPVPLQSGRNLFWKNTLNKRDMFFSLFRRHASAGWKTVFWFLDVLKTNLHVGKSLLYIQDINKSSRETIQHLEIKAIFHLFFSWQICISRIWGGKSHIYLCSTLPVQIHTESMTNSFNTGGVPFQRPHFRLLGYYPPPLRTIQV